MKEPFEPLELSRLAEDHIGDALAVDLPFGADDTRPARGDRRPHVGVGAEEVVYDLVARDDRGAVPRESAQSLGLASAYAAGDRHRDRAAAPSELLEKAPQAERDSFPRNLPGPGPRARPRRPRSLPGRRPQAPPRTLPRTGREQRRLRRHRSGARSRPR